MEATHKPLVSIIVPSFNQGRYIRDTIESCLGQDYRPLEVLVIDGASTDNTIEVLHRYDNVPEVRWISEKDSGVVEAVNKGFSKAQGIIASIQSSDDAYLPGALSQAIVHFLASPTLSIVYGDCVYADADGKEIRRYQSGPFSLENFLCKRTMILQPAAFFQLELARDVGGWNKDYFNADTEMWLRMIFRAPAKKVDAFWAIRRMHDQQRNHQAKKIIESYNRMVANSQDIARAPRRLKRAAKSGTFIHAAVYNPSGSQLMRKYYFWRAFSAFPRITKTPWIAAELFPFYWCWHRWYLRLSRGLMRLKRVI